MAFYQETSALASHTKEHRTSPTLLVKPFSTEQS